MLLYDGLLSSFQTIFSHKTRSLLTLLGIMIGVTAVVTMFSSIYGIKKMVNKNMKDMGWNNSIILTPSSGGGNFHRRRYGRFMRINRKSQGIKYSDYEYLTKNIKTKTNYGFIENYTSYVFENKRDRVALRATDNDYFKSKTYNIKEGRLFNKFDMKNAERVCILGHYFVKEKLKTEIGKVLGKRISVGSLRLKIIGVLDMDRLNSGTMNFNTWERRRDLTQIYIPLSTGAKYLRSNSKIDFLFFQAEDEEDFYRLKNEIRQTMLMLHNMAHDFQFQDIGSFMLKITQELNDMMRKWNITLTAIASISLIVGGIGLFSTLMISINERMTEIGIRKSIGATNFSIFYYFMIEALTLAIIAAISGILVSVLLISLIAKTASVNFPIPVEGLLLGIVFSILIGAISGLYPALKASRIDPIQAIFYFE